MMMKIKRASEWEMVKRLVAKSSSVEEALENCLGRDIIFVSYEIREKFSLSEGDFYRFLERFRFLPSVLGKEYE